MSEFLKNFRTAHSRFAGNKRNPYDGHYYPAQDRRNGNDRRNEQVQTQGKPSSSLYAKIEDFLPALQALLETITENQLSLLDLKKKQAQSGEEMASAFKDIAAALHSLHAPANNKPSPLETKESNEGQSPLTVEELEKTEMKSSADEKRDIIRIMKKLRKKGGTYKEIAYFLNENKIPTFSNKGHWHAQTIHRLCSQ